MKTFNSLNMYVLCVCVHVIVAPIAASQVNQNTHTHTYTHMGLSGMLVAKKKRFYNIFIFSNIPKPNNKLKKNEDN